eukprot:09553.XXX_453589_453834_1 [CDS] Oithona nana genome sequencing.
MTLACRKDIINVSLDRQSWNDFFRCRFLIFQFIKGGRGINNGKGVRRSTPSICRFSQCCHPISGLSEPRAKGTLSTAKSAN